MSDPARFLNAFAQAMAAMTLYRVGHPARERAVDVAYQQMQDLQADTPQPLFTFLGDEVVFGRMPLRDMKAWDWGQRLALAGVQRLEFEDRVTREDFEGFLEEVLARLTLSAISTEARQMRRSSIKFGAVGLKGEGELPAQPLPTATISFSLGEEVDTLRWLQNEVQTTGTVPLAEAETVVRSLAVAMHGDRQIMLPLLQLKEFDQYTTTHSMNVAVLAMALAEFLGLSATDVRAFGIAGLLHDIGKIKIPLEVLTKPGRLTDDERALMNQHPVAGARMLLEVHEDLDLAVVVAYEHHIMINGGGYPVLHYARDCHQASKLVHVCDVYDALRTRRPYREAWSFDKTLGYLGERSGLEFDPELCGAFVRMMKQWEGQVTVLSDVLAPVGAAPAAKTNQPQV
ncbi:MAG TPA: HD domain-containing phosphohydrolase [Gemmatimonadales bacterium]|jgi:putative nucleotidyltransferase with HDIG domain|nr:HD domain-containing phosphohydrolase [Gemmatimonadales bacterium]